MNRRLFVHSRCIPITLGAFSSAMPTLLCGSCRPKFSAEGSGRSNDDNKSSPVAQTYRVTVISANSNYDTNAALTWNEIQMWLRSGDKLIKHISILSMLRSWDNSLQIIRMILFLEMYKAKKAENEPNITKNKSIVTSLYQTQIALCIYTFQD